MAVVKCVVFSGRVHCLVDVCLCGWLLVVTWSVNDVGLVVDVLDVVETSDDVCLSMFGIDVYVDGSEILFFGVLL